MHKVVASIGMAAVLVLAACGGSGGDDTQAVDAQVAHDGRVLDAAPTMDAGSQIDAAATIDASTPDARMADATVADAGNPLTDAGIPPCMQLPASGGTILMGETKATSPIWNRPFFDVSCPSDNLSTVGTAVPYETWVFCNSGAQRTVDISMDGHDEQSTLTHTDPYLLIYSGAGIPGDPLQCADGNDDLDSTAGSGAGVTGVTVTAGGTFTVIATGYMNTDLGTYSLRLTVH